MRMTNKRWVVGMLGAVGASFVGLIAACTSSSDGAPRSPDQDAASEVDAANTSDSGGADAVDAAHRSDGGPSDASPDSDDGGADASADASVHDAHTPDAATTDADVDGEADAATPDPTPMLLTSGTIADEGRFPAQHTCNGANTSPPLAWTEGPQGTGSYAVVMKDLTVPNVHWIVYDIPAGVHALDANIPFGYAPGAPAPAGAHQSTVTFSPGTYGYLGPCPPKNATPDHQYVFTVYAVSGASVAGVTQNESPESIASKIAAQKVAVTAEASLHAKYMQP